MKRKLFVQMRNEWRSNAWLFAELLIISIVMWYVLVFFASIVSARMDHPGYDTEGVYSLGLSWVQPDSELYDNSRSANDAYQEDKEELVRRLREIPQTEAVSLGSMILPYNYNFSGNTYTLQRIDDPDSTVRVLFSQKPLQSEMVEVMHYEGISGETPQRLRELLDEGFVLVTENLFEAVNVEADDDAIKNVPREWTVMKYDSTIYKIGAVIRTIKRNDYEPAFYPTLVYPNRWGKELDLRVKPGCGREFEEYMDENIGKYRVGNCYISDVKSVEVIKEANQRDIVQMMEMQLACIGFLMLSIFLGLLGTFWFRTQQRVGEIAIRLANGATRGSIFSRLISEGLILLAIIAPLALPAYWVLLHYDLTLSYGMPDGMGMYVLCALVTFALLALMIVLGIWFPARKAMKIEPALVLKSE